MSWGLALAATPVGMWAQLCSGSSSPGARGQEGGRKWAAGQQVAAVLGSPHFPILCSQGPSLCSGPPPPAFRSPHPSP